MDPPQGILNYYKKNFCNKLFIAANNYKGKHDIKFSVVRYGNVMGSRGSVIPFFMEKRKYGILPITDERMTRFNISLQEGVDFVLKNFERMQGGEIFVPKIPSVRIKDLAEAMAPGKPVKIVGIRPGEKLHEIMCPRDDCHLTLEFDDHYVIQPAINISHPVDYSRNELGEVGSPVSDDFEYHSGNNPHFLTVEELREMSA